MIVTLFNSYYEKFADGKVACIDDEIPFEIPLSWEWVRLGDLCSHVVDCPHSTPKKSNTITQHPCIRTSEIKGGSIVWNSMQYLDEKNYQFRIARLKPMPGDIVYAREGVYGDAVILPLGYEFCLGQRTMLMRMALAESVNYIHKAIISPYVYSQAKALNREGTTNVGHVNMSDIVTFLIPLPPLSEQKRIVAKIEELMLFVDEYDKAQKKLDALNSAMPEILKKSILQDAIQGKLVPQDPNDEPASALLQRIREEKAQLLKEGKLKKKDIVDSVIFKGDDNKYYEQIGDEVVDITEDIPFEIPDSWEWIRFGNLVKMNIGKTPPRGDSQYWSNGVYPWVSISDMNDYGLIGSTKERISLLASEKIMGEISAVGTLLMSFKLTVGRTSILNIEAFHNEAIISIYPYVDKDFAIRDYLFYILPLIANSGESKDAIKGKTLNSKSLFNILVPLPSRDEQKRIVYKIRELYALL